MRIPDRGVLNFCDDHDCNSKSRARAHEIADESGAPTGHVNLFTGEVEVVLPSSRAVSGSTRLYSEKYEAMMERRAALQAKNAQNN